MVSIIKSLYRFWRCKRKFRGLCSYNGTVKVTVDSSFEGMNKIHDNSSFSGSLGYGSYIGHDCEFQSVKIGRFTSIGPYVQNNFGFHPYKEPFVATSPAFYSLNPDHQQNGGTFATEQLFEELKFVEGSEDVALVIGSDCWIGEGVLFTGGVKVGDGAVVLARAVVTKDVPPYAIVGGIPAKVIDYRYDEDTINMLMGVKWWNRDVEWIRKNWRLMSDMKAFMDFFQKTELSSCSWRRN